MTFYTISGWNYCDQEPDDSDLYIDEYLFDNFEDAKTHTYVLANRYKKLYEELNEKKFHIIEKEEQDFLRLIVMIKKKKYHLPSRYIDEGYTKTIFEIHPVKLKEKKKYDLTILKELFFELIDSTRDADNCENKWEKMVPKFIQSLSEKGITNN